MLQIEDETDELLLADDEFFDVIPELLPRRLLSDFSVYNSEVETASLHIHTNPDHDTHPFLTSLWLKVSHPFSRQSGNNR